MKNKNNTLIIIVIVAVCLVLITVGTVFAFLTLTTVIHTDNNEVASKAVELLSARDGELDDYVNKIYTSYEDYKEAFESNKLDEEAFKNNNYYIFKIEYDPCSESDFRLEKIEEKDGKTILDFSYESSCGGCAPEDAIMAYELDKDVKEINVEVKYSKARNKPDCPEGVAYKPMIYIYPEEDMNVSVKLSNPDDLGVTYPKYEDGWNVLAHKDGTLTINDRNYYGLFWEGENYYNDLKREGFVISGDDTKEFLEEKLELLGLSQKEINEFMVFWLPQMEDNPYNYIRFVNKDELDNYMSLEIDPKPDTLIRVFIEFKPLDYRTYVREQKLEKASREGYTVIEWGGSIID